MLEQARLALARRDADAALAAARAAVAAEPDRAEAHHAQGLAFQLAGHRAAAMAAFDRAIELQPDHPAAHMARAALALGDRDLGAAEASLREAVKADPNVIGAYVLGAHLALARGDRPAAEQQLKLAQRVAPEHPQVLAVEGNLALASGDNELAVRRLNQAFERAPDDAIILSSLGIAYLRHGNGAFAEQSLRRALELQPDAQGLRWALIESLRRQDRWGDMPTELDRVLRATPESERALGLLADCRLREGDTEVVLDLYRRLLALDSLSLGALDAMLHVLNERGGQGHAVAMLEERLLIKPGADVLWQRRMALASSPEDAANVAQRWLDALPGSPFAQAAQAQIAESAGALDAAEAQADAALGGIPGLATALQIKLRAELRRDPAAAAARCVELLKLAQDPVGQRLFNIWHGFALDRLGHYDAAAAAWLAAALPDSEASKLPEPQAAGSIPSAPLGFAPRLLWGPTGSRLAEVVSLLRSVPGLHVLDDRFGPGPRPDGLGPARNDGAISTPEGYSAILERRGFALESVVDCLPFWDARIEAALPGARLAVVIDDPRSLLLNWLAYGAFQGSAIAPAEQAAAWLNRVLEALAQRVASSQRDTLIIRAEALVTAATQVAAQLHQFYALPVAPDPAVLAAARIGLGGLPMSFEPDHWRRYASGPLQAAFAALQPMAERLGYAR